MKKNFSLSKFLHNDRILFIVSLIIAVTVWGVISFGPGNVQTRTITATVKIDLTDTAVGYNDLRVMGNDEFTVNVVVEGSRSVIYGLGGGDLEVKPTLTDIQGPGKSEVSLTVNKGGKSSGYSVKSVTPSTVTVECDYWTSVPYDVKLDEASLSLVTVAGEGYIPKNSADTVSRVTIEGPREVLKQIDRIVPRVEKAQTISATTRLNARLLALNAGGDEVDISMCEFTGIEGNSVSITVPVWTERKVDLTYTLHNTPAGVDPATLVTITNALGASANSITLAGEAAALELVTGSIGNLGEYDFDHILPDEATFSKELALPSGVTIVEGNVVTLKLNLDKYTTKRLTLPVRGVSDVTVKNLPEGKTLTLQEQQVDIILCGDAKSLREIKPDHFRLEVDAASVSESGSVRYDVRVLPPKGYTSVWVYYGVDDSEAPKLYGTLE